MGQDQEKVEKQAEELSVIVRLHEGMIKRIVSYLCISTAIFHIWANTIGNISDLWRNSLHLSSLGAIAFLVFPFRKKAGGKCAFVCDIVLSLLVASTGIYLVFFEEALHIRNEVPVLSDLVAAAIAILMAIELTRRSTGVVIPLLSVFFLTYVVWWGQYVEGIFSFRGMSLTRVLYRMFFTDEGLFGMIATISSTYVFMFILCAAFLLKSGGGDFIINLARNLTGRLTGGPGLVAVLGSGLMGTSSGSAVANTVSTGSITIPMMKKAGFEPKFAAGVETASSTGGQLMPPIMGAGAFIMAEWTQLPFTTIIGVAFLPAVLYFSSVAFYVFLEAKKQHVKGLTSVDGPALVQVVREGVHFFIPIGVLIGMLIGGFTPTYSAGFAILAVIVSSWLSKSHRMGFKDILDSLEVGARNMLTTGILLVTVGIVVGTINMTGASITFSQLVVEWSGGSLIFALVLITGASLLLGMGLPVTAAYVMLAILSVPALTLMGVSLLSAHMIIFWVSQDSNVTPPVCLAAFSAAAIAESQPMQTGLTAWKLAKGLYIMPLLFAYTALIDGDVLTKLQISFFALCGLFAFAVAMTGHYGRHLTWLSRILFTAAAVLLFWNVTTVNLIGLSVLLLLIGYYRYSREKIL